MLFYQIVILALIQGLTEFLPVSSSGHLIFLPHVFGWSDQGLEVDVALHVGTLMAVLLYFWRDLRDIIVQFLCYIFRGCQSKDYTSAVQLGLCLIVGTLPAVIVGFALKKMGMDDQRTVSIVAGCTIVFGLLMGIADYFSRHTKNLSQITLKQGLLIGLAQAVALIPGVSRSGICMTAALGLGFDRVSAARFSFLLSIPAILGAATLTGYDVWKTGSAVSFETMVYGIGFSMVFGFMAIHFMLRFLMRYSLMPLVIYRLVLGAALFFYPF